MQCCLAVFSLLFDPRYSFEDGLCARSNPAQRAEGQLSLRAANQLDEDVALPNPGQKRRLGV
jgi:hypothetical protein